MATFGNTNQEIFNQWYGWGDGKWAGKYVLASAGDVSKLTLYLRNTLVGNGALHVKAIIFSDSGGVPDTLLGTGTEVDIAANAAEAWVDCPFASPVSLQAGTYWLGLLTSPNGNGFDCAAADTGGNSNWIVDTYADGAATPWGAPTNNTNKLSVYATYTVPFTGLTVTKLLNG
jgi:hypothetical protein